MWKKGQSGNPAGRPRDESSWAGVLRRIGKEEMTVNGEKLTKQEAVCRKIFQLALKGDSWAILAIMDRVDGKPKVVAEVENSGGAQVQGIPVAHFITGGKDVKDIVAVPVISEPDADADAED